MRVGLTTVLVVLGVVCLIVLAVQWKRQRQKTLYRPYYVIAGVALVAFTSIVGWMEWRYQYSSHVAQRLATQYFGDDDIRVSCQRIEQEMLSVRVEDGWVNEGSPQTAHLREYVCTGIGSYMLSQKFDSPLGQVRAMAVLVHEGIHTQGILNEGDTECLTQINLPYFLVHAGASQHQAVAATERYVDFAQRHLPDRYKKKGCPTLREGWEPAFPPPLPTPILHLDDYIDTLIEEPSNMPVE